jgi:type I restriction enzyme, S subunit
VSELPDSWLMGAIADLVDVGSKNQCDDSTVVGFVPMNRMGKSFRHTPTFEARKWSEVKKGYTHFADGDVLVARITPCFENGKAGIARGLPNGMGAGSTEYVVLRPKAGVATAEYVLARLKTDEFLSKGAHAMTGAVGQQRVPKAVIESYPVPIAPFPEQQRISLKLTALLADVDACRERLDRVPQILKKFREAVLEAAVSGRLTEKWREANSAPRDLGSTRSNESDDQPFPLPETWHWSRLSAVSSNFDNKRVPIRASDRAKRHGVYPYYGAFGIIDTIDAFLYDGTYLLIAEDGKNLESRDRPIAIMASGRFWVNNHAHVIQAKEGANLEYLCHYLNSRALDLLPHLTGIDQVKLTRSALDGLPVPVPPTVEAEEVVRRISGLFSLADRMEARYTNAATRIAKLTPSILSKAFRGELVPQDPNDEPAGEMLERIRRVHTINRLGRQRNSRTVQSSYATRRRNGL